MLQGRIYVAFQSCVFCAFHSRPFEQTAVVFLAQIFPIVGGHVEEFFRRRELIDFGGLRKAVVWTGELAAVAAVDVVAHGLCFGLRDGVAVLDGEVGEATVASSPLALSAPVGQACRQFSQVPQWLGMGVS